MDVVYDNDGQLWDVWRYVYDTDSWQPVERGLTRVEAMKSACQREVTAQRYMVRAAIFTAAPTGDRPEVQPDDGGYFSHLDSY